MPFKDIEFGTACLFNKETGEEVMKFDNISEITLDCSNGQDYDFNLRREKFFYDDREVTMSINFNEPVDMNKFYSLLGVDVSKMPDSYDVQFLKVVQVRKHKKRRINKKWVKRYGYKTIKVISKGWKIHSGSNGTVEFIKD